MITETIDPVRGCGKRKPGGLYLVAGTNFSGCCALPIPLTVCPCCGQGIKFFRGFGWIEPAALFDGITCTREMSTNERIDQVVFNKGFCIIERLPEKMGLMWVGEQFYTTNEFTKEAALHGISKRIKSIPNDFKISETWLALAHKKAVTVYDVDKYGFSPAYEPGVFMFFKPSRIEYIVQGTETPEFLERLEKRGVTLVKIIGYQGEQLPLLTPEENE